MAPNICKWHLLSPFGSSCLLLAPLDSSLAYICDIYIYMAPLGLWLGFPDESALHPMYYGPSDISSVILLWVGYYGPSNISSVVLLWVGFHQVQHMHHNANNLPLWTWWQQHQNHSPPLTSRAKGGSRHTLSLISIRLSILSLSTCWSLWMSSPFVCAMVYQSDHALSEHMLKSLLYWICLFMLPLTVSEVCKKMFYKKNMTLS